MGEDSKLKEISVIRLLELLKKNDQSGKKLFVGLLDVPASLRLFPEDYALLMREGFRLLPEKTQPYKLDNGMVAFVRLGRGFGNVDPFVDSISAMLEQVISRQGLGTLPDDLWSEFRWPDDDATLQATLGVSEKDALLSTGKKKIDFANMLKGAISQEAVYDSCRRQAILEIRDSQREIIGHELYCSLDFLRHNHLSSFLLEGTGEIEILSRVLDEKVMALTEQLAPRILPDVLHLNLQVQTVFSDAFGRFLDSGDSRFARNLAIEVSLENAIADWWEFEDACKLLQAAGVRVGLDRITLPALEFLSPRKIKVDFLKVIWDQNIIGSKRATVAERLREFASVLGNRNLILTRCDTRTALRMGRSLGVGAFQGSYVDALLGNYLAEECDSPHAAGNERRCAVCQWAPRETESNGCSFHFRAGKVLPPL
ncbi:hypothetical protein TH25_18490 [Thalassospira profundimaris]|uniref:EAL domain-containing protein n=1 Tax=Thalassospira profundimaris TaxID=502049 RepID=A0A367WTU2_9PROT|nr:EAL domain-containing protein [Thalassospira profundimaris]RCK44886.1 hypothetical protein TH25_18490 [Thalassospira profundimaris]